MFRASNEFSCCLYNLTLLLTYPVLFDAQVSSVIVRGYYQSYGAKGKVYFRVYTGCKLVLQRVLAELSFTF